MEFLKIINQELHYRKALERLCVQFPEIIGNGAYVWDIFRVEWFREADKPYVLILNKYEKGRVIRKEWYEYYKGNWNYIGFLPRKECILCYRRQAWQKNHDHDFPTFEIYLRHVSSPKANCTTDEQAAQRFPENYFTQYHTMRLKK